MHLIRQGQDRGRKKIGPVGPPEPVGGAHASRLAFTGLRLPFCSSPPGSLLYESSGLREHFASTYTVIPTGFISPCLFFHCTSSLVFPILARSNVQLMISQQIKTVSR